MRRVASLRGRRRVGVLAAIVAATPALADTMDFTGTWSFNGHMFSSRGYVLVSPVCDFQQQGERIAGFCKGPNGGGEAAGLADGKELSFQWRIVPTNAIGVRGVASFNGAFGADGVIRGAWSLSTWPGDSGDFTGQRP